MTGGAVAVLASCYVVGGLASFFLNMFECTDGYLLSARILLWPLFVLKSALVMLKVAAADLSDWPE